MPFRKELFSFTIAERFCMALLETVSRSAVNITQYCSLPVRSFPLKSLFLDRSVDNLYKTECSFHTPCINMY